MVVQVVVFALLAAVITAGYVVLYRRATPRAVRRQPEYLIRPPADLPPALVGMLFEPNVTPEEIAATLLDLVRRNVIELNRPGNPANAPGRTDDDWQLVLHRDRVGDLSQFEQELVYEVFDHAGGSDTVRTCDLRDWWRAHPATALAIQAIWTIRLQQAMTLRGLIDPNARKMRTVLTLYGFGTTFAMLTGAVLGMWAGLFLSLGILMIFWAQRVTGVTQAGAELQAKYEAFRRYLADYGRFRDKPAEAVVLWEGYLELAVVLGLGDRAEAELRILPGYFQPPEPGSGRYPDEAEAVAYVDFRRACDPGLPAILVTGGPAPKVTVSGRFQGSLKVVGPGSVRSVFSRRHPAVALLSISPFVLFPAAMVLLMLLYGR